MKKLLLIQLAIFVSIGSLVACGDWKQDPLAGAKGLGKGQDKPDTKPDKAAEADVILIDAPLFKLGKEGEKLEVRFGARVIESGYVLTSKISNLGQFPGATFDSATGVFEWTPAIGTASEEISKYSLEFVAVATKPGFSAIKTRVAELGVARALLEPTIIEVSSLESEIREGDRQYFYVEVEDRTAGSDPDTYPTLVVRNSISVPGMAGFVEVASRDTTSPNTFSFKVEIDLTKAELTKNRTKLGFELLPVSKYQKAGASQAITYEVLNDPADVVSTWTAPIMAAPGSKIDYQFLVIDPKNEGKVNLDSVFSAPAGASLTCTPDNFNPVLSCRFIWDVPADADGTIDVAATFTNASTDYSDKYENSEDLYLPISIGVALGSN